MEEGVTVPPLRFNWFIDADPALWLPLFRKGGLLSDTQLRHWLVEDWCICHRRVYDVEPYSTADDSELDDNMGWRLQVHREIPLPRRAIVRLASMDALRDIVGDPWQPVNWKAGIPSALLHFREGLIPTLSRLAWDARDFDALPALADAVEEAGVEGDDDDEAAAHAIAAHLRSDTTHVRGCWALDLLIPS